MKKSLAILAVTIWAPGAMADPLPSWNAGPTKTAIVDFVERVTDDNGPDYVPPAERVAVFDNDGTLWAEQPMYFQFLFAIDRIVAMAKVDPAIASSPVLKAAAAGDIKAQQARTSIYGRLEERCANKLCV